MISLHFLECSKYVSLFWKIDISDSVFHLEMILHRFGTSGVVALQFLAAGGSVRKNDKTFVDLTVS